MPIKDEGPDPGSIPLQNSIHRVAVIGAGAWGTTLAKLLAEKDLSVNLWAHEPEVVDAILTARENTRFLPDVSLPPQVVPTGDLTEAVEDAQLLLFAVPSHVARPVLMRLVPLHLPPVPIVNVTKGIEEGSLKLMSQVIQDVLSPGRDRDITILSGPSFAREVCQGCPTAVLLAGEDQELVRRLQHLFLTPSFRVYAGSDVIGAQVGGALKNVMAIAAGVIDGLALGHNARAALITRGLAEMIRFGVALGADGRTLYGLSGLGDLALTCTGPLSRNHTVGVRLGHGETLEEIQRDTYSVAEGVRTSRAALGLAARLQVEMPIVQEVAAVLFEGKPPDQAVRDLMNRTAKEEVEPVSAPLER